MEHEKEEEYVTCWDGLGFFWRGLKAFGRAVLGWVDKKVTRHKLKGYIRSLPKEKWGPISFKVEDRDIIYAFRLVIDEVHPSEVRVIHHPRPKGPREDWTIRAHHKRLSSKGEE